MVCTGWVRRIGRPDGGATHEDVRATAGLGGIWQRGLGNWNGCGCWPSQGSTAARPAREFNRYGGEVMTETRTRANAVITVHNYEPVVYDEPAAGPVLTKIHVKESFSGDIVGDGVVEFLQAARDDASASFVGIERVTGTVAGRTGTFLLQDAGTVEASIVSGTWFVIPGSGTGELAGLRGEGGFRANLGEGAQVHLDCWFD